MERYSELERRVLDLRDRGLSYRTIAGQLRLPRRTIVAVHDRAVAKRERDPAPEALGRYRYEGLIRCPRCQSEVHDETQKCPRCGSWIVAHLAEPVWRPRQVSSGRAIERITAAILLLSAVVALAAAVVFLAR